MKNHQQIPKTTLCLAVAILALAGGFTLPARADTRSINVTSDTYVNSYYPNTNYDGSATGFRNDSTAKTWSYFEADLSGLSITAIESANLTITKSSLAFGGTCNAQNYITASIHEVFVDFNVSTLTYNLQPCGSSFDQSSNCNLTAERSFDALCNDWANYNTVTIDVTELVKREVAADSIVRFVIFPTYRNGTGTLAFGLHNYEDGYGAYLTLGGNFTWVVPTTTTEPPGVDDPAYDISGFLGYTGGTKAVVDALVTPIVWALLGCIGVAGFVAYKLDKNAFVFVGILLSLITLLTIFGIFPIWFILIELVLGAFIFSGWIRDAVGGGGQ